LGTVVVFFAIIGRDIAKRGWLKTQKLIMPSLLVLGTLFLILLESSVLVNQVVILLSSVILYIFLIFYKDIPISKEATARESLKIKNFFQFGMIFTAFLMFLTGYYLLFYYNFSLPIVTVFIILISSILLYYLVWLFEGRLTARGWLFVILFGLLVAEFFFILAFWPTTPWIACTVLVLLFYLYFGLFHLGMEGQLDIQKVWEYLAVVGVVLLVIMSIMKWNY
jgi:hypothetical protein